MLQVSELKVSLLLFAERACSIFYSAYNINLHINKRLKAKHRRLHVSPDAKPNVHVRNANTLTLAAVG